MSATWDADFVIVGAGPAGVAAAVMAASMRARVLVVEAVEVGAKLAGVGAVNNVAGGWQSGPALAEALAADLRGLEAEGLAQLVRARVVRVDVNERSARVVLDDGRVLCAPAVVVATGVRPRTVDEAPWVTTSDLAAPLPVLWQLPEGAVAPVEHVAVLGADRPLGTWLRSHPDVDVHFDVLYVDSDAHKVSELEDEARVRLDLVERVDVAQIAGGFRLTAWHSAGGSHTFTRPAVVANLGTEAAALAGLVRDADGYCPVELQHPRILVAGDLRSPRFQRISTAMGSGAEAVLRHTYSGSMSLQRA